MTDTTESALDAPINTPQQTPKKATAKNAASQHTPMMQMHGF